MLTLKKLHWDNCFSYGDNNNLELDKYPLTQLVGANGAGKTSISLMIQEALYGKNNKNIKKQDIENNKTNKKGYNIYLEFEKDRDIYLVSLERTSSLKLRLYKNNEDISHHTALGTYKEISNIIGIDDFKVFCQLIYQHSTDSLDFLTATDTNRKKFLINLLQLERYLELHEHFKEILKNVNSDINTVSGSIETIEAWINRHKDMDFLKQELLEMPDLPKEWITEQHKLEETISNINEINRKILNNKQYIDDLAKLDSNYYLGSAPAQPSPSVNELRTQIRIVQNDESIAKSKIARLKDLPETCSECMQVIDENITKNMIILTEMEIKNSKETLEKLQEDLKVTLKIESEIAKYKWNKSEFEKLNQLIDKSLPIKTYDKAEEQLKLDKLIIRINDRKREIKLVEIENNKISAHNSKVDVIKNQLDEMKKDLHNKNVKLIEHENLASVLELLRKTFSTNGLVSYKIESSVKELEKKINHYLAELTYFQIYFKLSGEKLNIEVVDDVGNVTSISNLSSGERARVNVCTVLAIRSILSSLTSTKINFLMLDEVINTIDEPGREKLAEILLNEKLNTFIVSHSWQHPLIPKIDIIKEHDISRIEYD